MIILDDPLVIKRNENVIYGHRPITCPLKTFFVHAEADQTSQADRNYLHFSLIRMFLHFTRHLNFISSGQLTVKCSPKSLE